MSDDEHAATAPSQEPPQSAPPPLTPPAPREDLPDPSIVSFRGRTFDNIEIEQR
jgi:hypothetical protein